MTKISSFPSGIYIFIVIGLVEFNNSLAFFISEFWTFQHLSTGIYTCYYFICKLDSFWSIIFLPCQEAVVLRDQHQQEIYHKDQQTRPDCGGDCLSMRKVMQIKTNPHFKPKTNPRHQTKVYLQLQPKTNPLQLHQPKTKPWHQDKTNPWVQL